MLAEAKVRKFGSIYDCEYPEVPGFHAVGSISMGDSVPGKEIPWVEYKNCFVSSIVLCISISWAKLYRQGFVFGKMVHIDGKPYFCRCLKCGKQKGAPNEWDAILDAVGEGDDIWHWSGFRFWCQDMAVHPNSSTYRAVRGGGSARKWQTVNRNQKSASIGFRPILEPLVLPTEDCVSLVGKQVSILGADDVSRVYGALEAYTDYDLILRDVIPMSSLSDGMTAHNGLVVIDRTRAIWMKEI